MLHHTNLMPKEIEKFGVNTFTDMKKGLKDCDIVMMLDFKMKE